MPTNPELVPGLHLLSYGVVNGYLLDSPDGAVLIDTGYPDKADHILKSLAELGRKPSDIRHILLTHAHPDHIGSAAALRRATGARVYASRIDAPLVRTGTGWPKLHPAPGLVAHLMAAVIPVQKQVEPCPVDQEIQEGDVLPLAGGLTVLAAPGHRAGQVCFLWTPPGAPDRPVLFAADAAMNLLGLRQPVFSEDLALTSQTLRRLATLPFEIVTFGHGKPILSNASARFRQKFK